MNHSFNSLLTTTLLLAGLWSSTAFAQVTYQASDGYRQPGFYDAAEQVGEEVEVDTEHKFSWFTMTPSIGYAYFPAGKLSAGTLPGIGNLELDIESRNAFVAKLHFDFGGDGVAVEMVPFLAVEAGGAGFSAASVGLSSDASGLVGGQYYAIGGQGQMVYRWKAGIFYPHLGLGGHLAYLLSGDIDYGAELYGRIPVGFTIYLLNNLGLTVEGGFMFGATGVKQSFTSQEIADSVAAEFDLSTADLSSLPTEEQVRAQAQQAAMEEISSKIKFGLGVAWDISVGIRFP